MTSSSSAAAPAAAHWQNNSRLSFSGNEFPRLSAVMAGELIAFYQLGYGVAAFGIGPLHDRVGLAFTTIFAMGSIVAVPLAVVAGFVIGHAVARG